MKKIIGYLSSTKGISGFLSSQSGLSGDLVIPNSYERELVPATTTTLGGIIVGDDLQITEDGVLSVLKANSIEEDNTRPITAAAVYTEIGNIDALLQMI